MKSSTKPLPPGSTEKLTIGRLAQLADVGVETIRYYERRGLIQRPRAVGGAFRVYPEEAKRRIHFIRRAKELGFTLNEIGELLSLTDEPTADRSSLKTYARRKIEDIERKLRDLNEIRQTLETLIKSCSGRGPLRGCPIMDALQDEPEPSPGRPKGSHQRESAKDSEKTLESKKSRSTDHCGDHSR